VINASIVDDLRPAAAKDRERARLLVLAYDGDAWHGEIAEPEGADIRAGQLAATFGGFAITHGGADITLRGSVDSLAIDLTLRAETFPSLASGVTIGDSAPINWLVVPRLVANGNVTIAGRVYAIENASAYHDHNWGFFSHRDFAWQWGHSAGASPHSVVLARLLDGGHTATFMDALLVWSGPRQARVFRGDELAIEPEGFLRPARPFTLPAAASLLVGHLATEVPSTLHIRAHAGGDSITGAFEATSVARIVVPHDENLDTTVIHEVDGHLRLAGTLHGARFELDAPAMFEFLRGVR
jgi:hypothetical protein